MLIRRPADIPSSEITPESAYLGRREFIAAAGVVGAGLVGSWPLSAGRKPLAANGQPPTGNRLDDKLNSFEDITHYNNYYEFGTGKSDPAEEAVDFKTSPWTVDIGGEVAHPTTYHLEDILHRFPSQDRTYRLRCVEAWSMVIPWQGFPLRDLINWVQPTSRARFVEFTTLLAPDRMPGQRRQVLPWPYIEALRMDEAMNPLTIMGTGLYGRPMPNQNGAPVRLIVPWKYGFKSGKALVRIRFVAEQPQTTWNVAAPDEYGFYANVNPGVDHPRWSQAREHRIGEFLRRPTLMFNGYGDQVAAMYAGMDLRRNY
ncbi:MAG TPA: protein-methionine-sulfoxide reductase catalytic subunit MsrP [Gemmatimonadales bacterium]|jgi:sulfoxide reductase catalytic subunit YedY